MTDPIAFLLAALALLATPGPTNTLLAAAGAAEGVRRALRLVPAELAGYALAIGILRLVFGPGLATHPGLDTALRLAAAAWLLLSAVTLWRQAGDGFAAAPSPVTPVRVFVTTLLNPKALIFAFVVLPTPLTPAHALGLAGLVVTVGGLWAASGGLLARAAGGRVTAGRIGRTAAAVLAVFALLLTGTAAARLV